MPTDRRRPAQDGLFIVGLIGRAGSGKSTVARALTAEPGGAGSAPLIEADVIGHEVTDHDPAVRAGLKAEYGDDIYRGDGALDRKRVAARVFSDPKARGRLDRLVHPKILERIGQRLDQLRIEGYQGIVVVDAALMLDWGLERSCDAVIAVTAPEALQVERLVQSRGWTADQARARLNVQRTNEDFAAAADVTLDNRGDVLELERAARAAVMRRMVERRATRPTH